MATMLWFRLLRVLHGEYARRCGGREPTAGPGGGTARVCDRCGGVHE